MADFIDRRGYWDPDSIYTECDYLEPKYSDYYADTNFHKYTPTTYRAPPISPPAIKSISEVEAVIELNEACNPELWNGAQNIGAIITALRNAGWKISAEPAIDADGKKGFILTLIGRK